MFFKCTDSYLFHYLRVFDIQSTLLIGTVVGNLINIILNSAFLFVFNWGVMGCRRHSYFKGCKSTDCGRHGRGTYKSKAELNSVPEDTCADR